MITIENCKFEFKCPKHWHALAKVDGHSKVRYCDSCEKLIHYCEIDDELIQRAKAGDCVAIMRTVDPQTNRKEMYLGGPVLYDYGPGSLLQWD